MIDKKSFQFPGRALFSGAWFFLGLAYLVLASLFEIQAQASIMPPLPKEKPDTSGQRVIFVAPEMAPKPQTRPSRRVLLTHQSARQTTAAQSSGSAVQSKTFGQRMGLTAWVMPSKAYRATAAKVGQPGSMLCNLTFDDGPHPLYDPQIMDTLDRYNAKATFYVLGRSVARHPDLAREMIARGHELGSHSWDHKNLRALSAAAVRADLNKTDAAIRKVLGRSPTVFRPPYGNHNQDVLRVAKTLGMETQLWTVDSLDWKRQSQAALTDRVISRTKPGAVILLHSIQKRAVEALPLIMDGLVAKGCRFVTSSEWVRAVSG